MTHTPGPWFSQYDDNGFYEIGSETISIRLAFTYGEGDGDEANARLIAAAPDLLEALKACADWLDWLVTPHDDPKGAHAAHIKQARAAIAKATGGNNV